MSNKKPNEELPRLVQSDKNGPDIVINIKDYWLSENEYDDLEADILLMNGDELDAHIREELGDDVVDRAMGFSKEFSEQLNVNKTDGRRRVPIFLFRIAACLAAVFFVFTLSSSDFDLGEDLSLAGIAKKDLERTNLSLNTISTDQPTATIEDNLGVLVAGPEVLIRNFPSAQLEVFIDEENWKSTFENAGKRSVAFSLQITDENPNFMLSASSVKLSAAHALALSQRLSDFLGFDSGRMMSGDTIKAIYQANSNDLHVVGAMFSRNSENSVACEPCLLIGENQGLWKGSERRYLEAVVFQNPEYNQQAYVVNFPKK